MYYQLILVLVAATLSMAELLVIAVLTSRLCPVPDPYAQKFNASRDAILAIIKI